MCKVGVAKDGERFSLLFRAEGALRLLVVLDKDTLQYATLAMVHKASKLVISEDNASEGKGDDCDAVWSIASTGVPEVFFLELKGLK